MSTTTAYAWAPITKAVKQSDGTLMVYGPATDAGLDRDRQRMNQAWLDKAMPRWMAEGGNIREQHDSKRAVGVGVGLTKDDDTGAWMLASHVVDPVAVKKVETGVLKGYSIGVKEPVVEMGKADAPNGEVTGGYICEVSLADRPSNPRTMFMIAKADGADDGLAAVEDSTIVESPDAGDTEGDPEDADGTKTEEPDLVKRDFSTDERKKLAGTGAAMADGSFPITDAGSLKDAIHLWGNAHDPQAAKRHIIARARALGLVSQLPDDWSVSKADALLVQLGDFMPRELAKYDEAADIEDATQAMAIIARLIASEAGQLATGRGEEAQDIGILLDAHRALDYFRRREQNQAQMSDQTSANLELADTPSDGESTTQTDVPDLVKTAVAEATKTLEERAKELANQLAQLKADVAAMPQPGGPVLTKTAPTAAPTANEQRAEAQRLLAKADRADDPVLAAGYRARAAELTAA